MLDVLSSESGSQTTNDIGLGARADGLHDSILIDLIIHRKMEYFK